MFVIKEIVTYILYLGFGLFIVWYRAGFDYEIGHAAIVFMCIGFLLGADTAKRYFSQYVDLEAEIKKVEDAK